MDRTINMRRILLLLLAGALISTTSYAYNWTIADNLRQKAEDLLRSAEVREIHSYRFNTIHCVLFKDGRVVGVIWEGTKDGVSVGEVVPTGWGAKAMLVKNGEVVGQLFLDWTRGHGHRCGRGINPPRWCT